MACPSRSLLRDYSIWAVKTRARIGSSSAAERLEAARLLPCRLGGVDCNTARAEIIREPVPHHGVAAVLNA